MVGGTRVPPTITLFYVLSAPQPDKDLVSQPETALLQVQGIAKSYGPVVALRSVDLSAKTGEIHALLGANGAGKSTLVKILSGVFTQDTGTVTINGSPIHLRRPKDSRAAGIATVFQDPALIPDLSINQNLTISGLDKADVSPWLERLELADLEYDRLVRDIPLATLRLVDLARALAWTLSCSSWTRSLRR